MSDLVRGGAPAPPAPAEPGPAHPPHAGTAPRVGFSVRPGRGPAPDARPSPPVEEVEPARPADASTVQAVTEAAEELFGEIERFLAGVPESLRRGTSLPWAVLEGLMERALDALDQSGELFWVANRPIVPPGTDYLAFHQARVGVLAMRVAGNVGYERRRRLEIGIAGTLIDIGLWQLPPAVLRRVEALTPEEQTQYRAHPRVAAELLRRWSPPYAGLPEMVAQHHEREQGQGFPQGLTAAAIQPEAKLLGLVDTYTGLTAPPSLRPGFRPHEAIREIVRAKHESFPPAIIKALLSEISVFPPGTHVRLNTGEVGRVVAVNRHHPLRPRVEIYDDQGQRLAAPKVIDLSETPFLYITGPIAEGER